MYWKWPHKIGSSYLHGSSNFHSVNAELNSLNQTELWRSFKLTAQYREHLIIETDVGDSNKTVLNVCLRKTNDEFACEHSTVLLKWKNHEIWLKRKSFFFLFTHMLQISYLILNLAKENLVKRIKKHLINSCIDHRDART